MAAQTTTAPREVSALLTAVEGVAHGFFGRQGGVSDGHLVSLNVGRDVGDADGSVDENLRRICGTLSVAPHRLATARQVHSARVVEVDGGNIATILQTEADALITSATGVGVGVRTADCVPMLVAAPEAGVVAAVHGGWRGLAAGIIEAVAEAFVARGAPSASLRVAIGPHIGPCCYEVGEEVVAGLGADSRVERAGRLYADLEATAVARWRGVGVAEHNIDALTRCVSCESAGYFSHRRDRGRTGRQLAVIALAHGA